MRVYISIYISKVVKWIFRYECHFGNSFVATESRLAFVICSHLYLWPENQPLHFAICTGYDYEIVRALP